MTSTQKSTIARSFTGTSVLLVEDDAETRDLIARALTDEGCDVVAVGRAHAASDALRTATFSAIILDVGLPDGSGISCCREWRRTGLKTPILILTAWTDVSSRVDGLDAGADDYVGKPFAIAELRARLRALLRRASDAPGEQVFRHGDLVVDFGRRRVQRGADEIPLTRRELEVLERLVRARGHAVPREELLDEIWGAVTSEAGASLEVIVGRLRRKLDTAGGERLIRTIRGHGYALAADGAWGGA
jgi:DNA-binding response OmpR family regulator